MAIPPSDPPSDAADTQAADTPGGDPQDKAGPNNNEPDTETPDKKAPEQKSSDKKTPDKNDLPAQWQKTIAGVVQVIVALFALFGAFIVTFAPPLSPSERLVVPLVKLLGAIVLLLIYAEAVRRKAGAADADDLKVWRRNAWVSGILAVVLLIAYSGFRLGLVQTYNYIGAPGPATVITGLWSKVPFNGKTLSDIGPGFEVEIVKADPDPDVKNLTNVYPARALLCAKFLLCSLYIAGVLVTLAALFLLADLVRRGTAPAHPTVR